MNLRPGDLVTMKSPAVIAWASPSGMGSARRGRSLQTGTLIIVVSVNVSVLSYPYFDVMCLFNNTIGWINPIYLESQPCCFPES